MEVVQARDGTNSTKTQPGRAKTVKKCRQEMVADPRATQRSPSVLDVRVTSREEPAGCRCHQQPGCDKRRHVPRVHPIGALHSLAGERV